MCLCAWLTYFPAWPCQVVLDGPSQQIVYSALSQILADERRGLVTDLVSEDESKLATDALMSHLLVLAAGSNQLGLPPHRLLLPGACTTAEGTPVECGMRGLRSTVSPCTMRTLDRIAARRNVTLNSILLGTLATQLRAHSGQDQFAINQTYLGRRPDQMRAVGSYSGFVAMEFTLDDGSSLLSTCQHAFTETMRNMAASDRAVANAALLSNVAYELNDVRPIPRPSLSHFSSKFVLCDLFFLVNEFVDGFTAEITYDVSKFEDAYAETLLKDWLLVLEQLDDLEG